MIMMPSGCCIFQLIAVGF